MSKRTPSSDSAEKTKTIKWNWNKDAFIYDQQTQYPGIRVESMFEGVGRLVYEVESLLDAVIKFYAYSAHRYSDNRPIITERELDSPEYINELEGSIFVKVMREIAGKAKVGSQGDVETLQNVLKERDYFLHKFFHEYNKRRLEAGWMDDRINQLKAALVIASTLTEKYRDAVDLLVDGINKPKKRKPQVVKAEAEGGSEEAEGDVPEDADAESEDEEESEEEDEDSEDEDDGDSDDDDVDSEEERPYRRDGYDGRRSYNGDRPRNSYNRGGDRRDGYRNDRRPYNGDRPRNGGYGNRPRNNNYHRDGERRPYNGDRKPYSGDRKPYNGDRKPYNGDRKPYNGDRKPYNGDRREGGYQKRDGDRPYGDRPRNNNYHRDGDRKPYSGDRKPYNGDRKPYGDRPRNGGYGDRPRNGYNRDGPRDRKPYNGDRHDGGYQRDGDRPKRPYKPRGDGRY